MRADTTPLLQVEGLSQTFDVNGRKLRAVSDLSLTLSAGETLGLVGESGCGKSTAGRSIIRLNKPSSGRVLFDGTDLATLSDREFMVARRRILMIFQDPVSALNPRRQVVDIVAEGLRIIGASEAEVEERVTATLRSVGFDPAVVGHRRPHQLSGGQCQRVAIARALVLEPSILICDEPVASLDVSVQGQVLNLLADMQERMGLAMIFISHDLSVVHKVSDRIAVMYLGKLVELAPSDRIVNDPAHPYTRALLDAVPNKEATDQFAGRTMLRGEVPSPFNPPSGCAFRTRCPHAAEVCAEVEPPITEVDSGHTVACHFPLGRTAARPVRVEVAAPAVSSGE